MLGVLRKALPTKRPLKERKGEEERERQSILQPTRELEQRGRPL